MTLRMNCPAAFFCKGRGSEPSIAIVSASKSSTARKLFMVFRLSNKGASPLMMQQSMRPARPWMMTGIDTTRSSSSSCPFPNRNKFCCIFVVSAWRSKELIQSPLTNQRSTAPRINDAIARRRNQQCFFHHCCSMNFVSIRFYHWLAADSFWPSGQSGHRLDCRRSQ